ncbi:MAG: four helix bundle protein [Crocinitomicaceae bacterium]
MTLTPLQELLQAKTLVRKKSRDLIEVIFKLTEIFPQNDLDDLRVELRKKSLSISSFISHGTAQTEKKDQADHFLAVMSELREMLKLTNLAYQKKYLSDKLLAYIRMSISDVITSLDRTTKLLGCFDV